MNYVQIATNPVGTDANKLSYNPLQSTVTPANYPSLFVKGTGRGMNPGFVPEIYGTDPNPSVAKPSTDMYTSRTDYCIDNKIVESRCVKVGYWPEKILAASAQITCPNDCSNGACIR